MACVLVTGASGLLGSTLVPVLRERGHEVVSLSHSGRGHVSADLTDPDGVRKALDGVGPDVIVNLAALSNVDECERHPQLAYLLNTFAVESIVRWVASRHGRCHFVQISTDQVYDGAGPHKETDIRPINYYAFSKYAGELIAARAGATVLRTNLFGRSRCPGRASFSDWLVSVMRRREPTKVFEDVLFTPLSMETLAAMIGVAVERRIAGLFNLGSKGGMSKADFAFELARRLHLPTDTLSRVASSEVPLGARRPKDMRMDSELFESRFEIELPTLENEIDLMRDAYANET